MSHIQVFVFGSGHKGAVVLSLGFGINWWYNQVARQRQTSVTWPIYVSQHSYTDALSFIYIVHIVYMHNIYSVNMVYRKTSNIRRTLVGNKIVDHSDVVGAPPVGAAPTTSSFST